MNAWRSVCPHGIYFLVLVYFSFSRISSALIPPASSFFTTASASVFLASSAALASAFAFFASRDATSFSAFFRAVFFSFKSAFKVSMFGSDGCDLSSQGSDRFPLLCNPGSKIGLKDCFFGVLGTVFAAFRSGHR